MGRPTKYFVSLSQNEKMKLTEMSKDNNLSSRIINRVLILLALDNKVKSNLSMRQIASSLNTTTTTIVTTAKDYCLKGLNYSLSHHFNQSSIRTRKINEELEAHVIQLACSKAPQGHDRWTLDLLTHEANKKGLTEPISKETIRLMLKKMNLSLT